MDTQNMKQFLLLVILSGSLSLQASFLGLESKNVGFGEAYYKIKDIKERKKAFMDILHPLVVKAQEKILEEQDYVRSYFKIKGLVIIPTYMKKRMLAIDKKYHIKKNKVLKTYLTKIDIIHEPLVLAQAAVESAWGTSRFTKLANNIFGEWTWGKKGIIPAGRPAGKKYKIRIFDTIQESVDAYMLNLNRHYRYDDFRQARYAKRKIGKCFQGKEATNYLQAYSGIGDEYAKMLKGVINYNKMCEYSLLKDMINKDQKESLLINH